MFELAVGLLHYELLFIGSRTASIAFILVIDRCIEIHDQIIVPIQSIFFELAQQGIES